ncbi:hypothetical protein V8C42DRAFT_331212 [Trichoderma barbatum]
MSLFSLCSCPFCLFSLPFLSSLLAFLFQSLHCRLFVSLDLEQRWILIRYLEFPWVLSISFFLAAYVFLCASITRLATWNFPCSNAWSLDASLEPSACSSRDLHPASCEDSAWQGDRHIWLLYYR